MHIENKRWRSPESLLRSILLHWPHAILAAFALPSSTNACPISAETTIQHVTATKHLAVVPGKLPLLLSGVSDVTWCATCMMTQRVMRQQRCQSQSRAAGSGSGRPGRCRNPWGPQTRSPAAAPFPAPWQLGSDASLHPRCRSRT